MTPNRSSLEVPGWLTPEIEKTKELQSGAAQIFIREGVVIEIERSEKTRLSRPLRP